jgi:hypothetical protein
MLMSISFVAPTVEEKVMLEAQEVQDDLAVAS